MIRIVMLAAGMLVIGVAAATAQEKDCFSVTSPAQATMGLHSDQQMHRRHLGS
jgi:hypothetical protein